MTEPLPEGTRPGAAKRVRVAAAAMQAGHELSVERDGKRFRIACRCGWSTAINWTRKKSMEAATDHMIRAGRTYLGETPALGTIPPVAGSGGRA